MEHGHVNPNLETEPSENCFVQDEGGAQLDTNIAGPSESKESLLIKLGSNQSNETMQLNNNNDKVETPEFGNISITESIIQDKESEKNQYICKFCFQVFDKHQALGGHMNGHSKDQRNFEKFGKVTTWIHATYPPPLDTVLASEAELQSAQTNEATGNSYNHLVEVGNVYSPLGGQWTNQQSTQQIQLSQGLQVQQLQYFQAQEPQRYQYSQGLQSNRAPKSLQSTQALQSPQNFLAPQRLQNFQTPQGLQNHQASQGSQNYQTLQQFQNYQTPQELEYYQNLQGSQNYQALQGPQHHQTLQRFQNYQIPHGTQSYQTPQGSQSYQALQGSQSYQAPRGSQSYQTPQGSQSYQAPRGSQSYQDPQKSQSYQTPQGSQSYQTPQGSQSYQAPRGSQSYQAPEGSQSYQVPQRSQSYQTPQVSESYQTPQGQWQQLVADANNQQNINLNYEMSNKPKSLTKVPSNEEKNDSSNSQGLHFQKEAQGPQRYMPNPCNLRNGDRLTTGPFINEQMNKEYYAKLGYNVLKNSNQMISTPYNYNTLAQYKPTNSPNTSDSFNQSKGE